MKNKQIEIDGKVYEVREISLEDGMPLINEAGRMDMAGLVRLSTMIDGQPAQPGQISLGVGMKLMPLVMELNSFSGGNAGNG
jgi:hypothetical protein